MKIKSVKHYMALLACALLWTAQAEGQGISGAVSITPANATADSLITITFDPRLDCEFGTWQSLVGEPVVKMHSGVTINGTSWNNIVWYDQPSATGIHPTMTQNPDSTWSITLIPRWFYGVAPGVPIEAINCVFNNGSWNKEGKDYDYPGHCIDFYIPLQTAPSWNSVWHKTYNQLDATRRWIINMSMDRPDCAWGAARVQSGTHYPGFVRIMNNGLFRRSDFLYNYPGYRPVMIASAGADSAWILAMNSGAQQIKIFNTTDGGWVWNVQADSLFDMGQGSYTNVIHFWNNMEGIILGDPVNGSWDIYRTSDAGATWTRLDTNNIPVPLASEAGVEMAYSAVGDAIFFSTSGARMFKSTDRGLHWSAVSCPVTTKFTFANAMEGWLIQNGTSNLFHTVDGGSNWNQISYTGTLGGYNIKHVPGTSSTLVSSNGGAQGIHFSLNGGQSWSPAGGPEFERVYGIGIYDMNHGWAGGYSDTVQNLPMFRLVTPMTPVVGNVYYSKPLPCQGENITAWPDILVPVNQWEWILPWSTQPHLSDMFPNFTSATPGPKDVHLRVHNAFGVYDFHFNRAITFREKPDFSLGTDTSLCIGQCADLLPEVQQDLFFSEYIEGSGFNRALEIYNGTGQTVDMHDYALWKNYNGSGWDGVYQFAQGTALAPGDVLVIAHAQADSAILSVADIVLANTDYNYMMGYTGDDVRALVRYMNGDTTILDYVGSETLENPGWSWRVGNVWGATSDHTLVRKPFIDHGQVYWDIAAGTDDNSSEWMVFNMDDYTNLGWHQTMDPYAYQWTDANLGSTLDTSGALHFCQPNQHPSNLSLKLTDTWGCYRTDDISITPGFFSVDIAGEYSICSGNCTELTATAGASYQWNTGDTTRTITVCPQTPTAYRVTVTDATGCSGSNEHFIWITSIQPQITTSDDTLCGDEQATLSAPGYAHYLWSTGDTTPTTLAWHPGNYSVWYSVTVSDSVGCTGTATVSILHLEKPQLLVSGDLQINLGDCSHLLATGGQQYLWSTGVMAPGITVCPQTTTTYSVQSWYLTGGFGSSCRDTAWITVEVLENLSLDLSPDPFICSGACATLSATGNGSLLWSTGDTTSQITVCPVHTQAYTVTLTGSGGQTLSGSITVNVVPEPQTGIFGGTTVCAGECTTLTGIGAGTFAWSTGDTSGSISLCPTQTQWYSLTFTDPNGCTATDSIILTVHPLPTLSLSPDTSLDFGQCVTLSAGGGIGYQWSHGAAGPVVQVCPTTSTTYTVTVYTAEGCADTGSVYVGLTTPVLGFSLRAYLSGAYLGGGLMRTTRSTLPAFPLQQPYAGAPWNYAGTEAIDSTRPDLVDWVLLEYRAAADCTLIAARQALLLLRDGAITDPSGQASL
ncbi:MAG TPA: lamin tail domain-containing protein, partial [Bacteroidales bacterium]|nr:lamin tail domain-containing protein [Bacteroidales bacterium]